MANGHEEVPSDPTFEAIWMVIRAMGEGVPEHTLSPSAEHAIVELRSGMAIGDSPVRGLLEEKLTAAFDIDRSNASRSTEDIARANRAADSVAEVPGITIIEPGDYGVPFYRCVQFAFGTMDGRAWAQAHDRDVTMDFWENTTNYLIRDGYELVNQPQEGDIIVYARQPGPTVREAIHVSVLGRNGMAKAKFNQGPIVEHPIDVVPRYYGTYLYFFRRRPE